MKFRIGLIFLLTLVAGTTMSGQNSKKKITINGLVVDQAKNPVVNAIIFIDGQKTSHVTDDNGFYKIKIKDGSTRIGIFTITNGIIEETINGRTTINFTLTVSFHKQSENQKNPSGEEEINVGYGTVKKKDLTQPVSKMDVKNSKYASYTNIYQMLSGEVPGVRVNGTSIIIQGASSFNSSTEPLFVVDGIPRESIDDIPPQMVKSIEVLKGASATIYGTRGACGVILINLIGAKDEL